jgi:hypothetical protein
MIVRYSANNSGGHWWLEDEDWHALEQAGWNVKWVKDDDHFKGKERWLGALAREATIECESIEVAIAKWEHVTGQNSQDQGCSCCGTPHNFYEEY